MSRWLIQIEDAPTYSLALVTEAHAKQYPGDPLIELTDAEIEEFQQATEIAGQWNDRLDGIFNGWSAGVPAPGHQK